MKEWINSSNNYGIEPIQCPRIAGKNSTDILMSVDIMETLYCVPYITTYFIVTTDSDYRHVISKVRKHNKKLIALEVLKLIML
jgi:uncharacterized LabA/DUF88 family protein